MTAEKEDRRYEWLLSFLSKDVDYGGYANDHDDDAMVMLMMVMEVMVTRKIKRLQGLLLQAKYDTLQVNSLEVCADICTIEQGLFCFIFHFISLFPSLCYIVLFLKEYQQDMIINTLSQQIQLQCLKT